jgi:hypothetical protein
MNETHHRDSSDQAFKPPRFLFYYMQRIFIWGQWSIVHARYSHRRELLRYQQQHAQSGTISGDKI